MLDTQATGIRAQIEDGVQGRLLSSAEDPEEIAQVLSAMLDSKERDARARCGVERRRTPPGKFPGASPHVSPTPEGLR